MKIFQIILLVCLGQANLSGQDSPNNICDTIYTFGEKLPLFSENEIELLNYNVDHIAPLIAESSKTTGILLTRLYYTLTISKTGKVVAVFIRTDMDEQLRNNIKQTLLQMPYWQPGEVDGKPVCMETHVPISCFKWD